jgi:hypothetical protein
MLDCLCENVTRLVEIVAAVKHALDARAIRGSFPDFLEVAIVCEERIVSFLVGPVVHCSVARRSLSTIKSAFSGNRKK